MVNECRKTASSGHTGPAAHVNFKQLGQAPRTESQHREGSWVRSPAPSQELQAIDNCWERKSLLSLEVLPWPGGKKKDTSLVGREGGESGRREGIG